MTEIWNSAARRIGDAILGGLLAWSQDAALVGLVVLSVVILAVTRRLVARPDLLRSAKNDERQLRRLIRSARSTGKTEDVARYQRTRLRVAAIRLREELRSALVALLPLALLVTWGNERLRWEPLVAGAPLMLRVELPAIWVGEVLHVVPEPHCQAVTGWLQSIELESEATANRSETTPSTGRAIATWQLKLVPGNEPRQFAVRFRDRTLLHPWRNADGSFAASQRNHGDSILSFIERTPYRPFNLIPDTSPYGIPAWLVVYLPAALAAAVIVGRRSG